MLIVNQKSFLISLCVYAIILYKKSTGGDFLKKKIAVCSILFLSAIIILGIYISLPPATVDFRGEIVQIENTDKYVIYTLEGIDQTTYTVLADERTNLQYWYAEDGEVSLGDIKIGDTIQGNYKTWFSEENYAKEMEVLKH